MWDSRSRHFFFVVTFFVAAFFFVQLTAVLAWRPHLHSQKWLSCSVQSLEMFSCVLSCEEDTALSIIDPTSALVELNNARRQKGRKNAGLLDFAEEQLPSLEVSLGQFSILCKLENVEYCSATTRTGALGRRLSNHNGFWKQKILKFIC